MHCLHSLFSFQSSYTILHLKSYRRHPYTGICCSSIIAAVSSSSSSSSVVWHIWVKVDSRPLCSTGGWNRWVGKRWSRHSLQFKLYNLFLQFRQLLSELPLIHCIQGLPMRGHILGNTGSWDHLTLFGAVDHHLGAIIRFGLHLLLILCGLADYNPSPLARRQ